MSTRAQIMVKGSPVLVYRHSDGYPQGVHGVLDFLQGFVSRFVKERGNDPEYFLAQYLRHLAIHEETQARENQKDSRYWPSNRFLGHGLDCVIHGDIEFLYVIDLSNGSITYHQDDFQSVYSMNKRWQNPVHYVMEYIRPFWELSELTESCFLNERSNMSQLSILQGIRKPATPSGNRHGGRKPPRPTRAEIAALLEEEMDEGEADDKIPKV